MKGGKKMRFFLHVWDSGGSPLIALWEEHIPFEEFQHSREYEEQEDTQTTRSMIRSQKTCLPKDYEQGTHPKRSILLVSMKDEGHIHPKRSILFLKFQKSILPPEYEEQHPHSKKTKCLLKRMKNINSHPGRNLRLLERKRSILSQEYEKQHSYAS